MKKRGKSSVNKRAYSTKQILISPQIIKKWAGKTGAIIGGKIIAGGADSIEAIRNAQKIHPDVKEWEIGIISIPPKEGYWILTCPK